MQLQSLAPAPTAARRRVAVAVDAALTLMIAGVLLYGELTLIGTSGNDAEGFYYLAAFVFFNLPLGYSLAVGPLASRRGPHNGQTVGGRLTRTRRVLPGGRPVRALDAIAAAGEVVDAVELIPFAGEVFISYSRRDLYFAEHLARRLRDRGADVWIDVARLAPGVDWEASVEAALTRAAAVVLVASPAAMGSDHVLDEWRRATAAGTPVHVALSSATDLAATLPAASVVDLRGRFEVGVDALGRALVGHVPPAPGRRLRPRLPLAVGIVALQLLLIALTLVGLGAGTAWALLETQPGPTLAEDAPARFQLATATAWWLVFTVIGCLALWRLLRRRFQPYWLFMWTLFGPMLPVLILIQVEPVHEKAWEAAHGTSYDSYVTQVLDSPFSRVSELSGWAYALGFVGFLVVFVAYWSAGLFRWAPTGFVDDRVRTAHGLAPVNGSAGQGLKRLVSFHGDGPADEEVVARASAAVQASGHDLASAETADAHVVVISGDTRRGWLDALGARLTGEVLCVFATAVRSPGDIGELARRQWVDYRRRQPATLEGLARSLGSPHPGVSLLPERIERVILPGLVALLAGWLLVLAGLALGTGLAGLLVAGATSLDSAARLAAGAAFAWLALGLRERRVTRATFIAAAAGAAAALAQGGGVPIALVLPGATGADLWWWAAVSAAGVVMARTPLLSWLPTRLRPRAADALGQRNAVRGPLLAVVLVALPAAAVLFVAAL